MSSTFTSIGADVHDLGGVADAAPRHVGDVEQAVEPAQVDEGAEVGDVLDHALADLPDEQLLHQRLALLLALGLEDHAARHHDVPAALVELDDLELVGLADEVLDVRDPAERDLRAGQEGVHAHQVDRDAALDLADERALDRRRPRGLADLLPDPQEVGLLLGEDDDAVVVLEALQQDLDLFALLGGSLNSSRATEPSLLKPNSRMTAESVTRRTCALTISPSRKSWTELSQQRLELGLGGVELLLAVRIVEELGRDPLGNAVRGQLVGGEGGHFAGQRIDDDILVVIRVGDLLRIGHGTSSRAGSARNLPGLRGSERRVEVDETAWGRVNGSGRGKTLVRSREKLDPALGQRQPAHEIDDGRDLLIECELGGVDLHGSLGHAKRRDVPARVDAVAILDRTGLLGQLRGARHLGARLTEPPARALLEVRDQVDLQVGVRKDHRAHVAPVGHQATPRAGPALEVEEARARGRQACKERDPLRHPRAPQLAPEDAVAQANLEPCLGGTQAHSERPEGLDAEALPLRLGHTGLEEREGERAVEGARVEVAESQSPRDLLGRRRLARPGRAVERDDRTLAPGCHGASGSGPRAHPPAPSRTRCSRRLQNPGKLTSAAPRSSIAMRFRPTAPRTPNAIAMR
jgi:hypothetical protein